MARVWAEKFKGYDNLILGRLNVANRRDLTDQQRRAIAAAESHGSTNRFTDMKKLDAGVALGIRRPSSPAPSEAAEGAPPAADGGAEEALAAPANEHGVPVGAAAAGRQLATSAGSDTAEAAPAPVVAQSVQGYRPKRFLHRPHEAQLVPRGYFDDMERGAERLSTALSSPNIPVELSSQIETILIRERERLGGGHRPNRRYRSEEAT